MRKPWRINNVGLIDGELEKKIKVILELSLDVSSVRTVSMQVLRKRFRTRKREIIHLPEKLNIWKEQKVEKQ